MRSSAYFSFFVAIVILLITQFKLKEEDQVLGLLFGLGFVALGAVLLIKKPQIETEGEFVLVIQPEVDRSILAEILRTAAKKVEDGNRVIQLKFPREMKVTNGKVGSINFIRIYISQP
jgi:uncharacterized membrane protein